MEREQIATAQACISAISSGIASLPPRVYRTDASGKAEVTSGPFAQLFRRPNRHITYCDLIQWFTAETLIWGNGLMFIQSGPDGTPVSLNPIPWKGVNVLMLASGEVVYDIPNGQGGMNRLLATDVVHIRERSTGNPLVGTPRLSKCPDVVRAALGAQNFAVQVFEHGATPSGIVAWPRVYRLRASSVRKRTSTASTPATGGCCSCRLARLTRPWMSL